MCEGADPGGMCKLLGWRRVQQKTKHMNPSCDLPTPITKLKSSFLPALEISCAVSAVVFALDSTEREKHEGSTAPYGAKDVVSPSSRAQSDKLR